MSQNLIEYGIQNEQSDVRIHVSIKGKCLYVFPTAEARNEVLLGRYKEVNVQKNGAVTAKGFLVPPSRLKGIQKVMISEHLLNKLDLKQNDSPSVKGEKAAKLVNYLIRRGEVPLPAKTELVTDVEQQLEGVDILVVSFPRIQVKLDYRGGDEPDCSGFLFLQTAEANPNKEY